MNLSAPAEILLKTLSKWVPRKLDAPSVGKQPKRSCHVVHFSWSVAGGMQMDILLKNQLPPKRRPNSCWFR
jgi:hypothetical protein